MQNVLFCFAAGFCSLPSTPVRGDPMPHPKPVISSVMPVDADAPVDPELDEIAAFDDYSWRAFIALNWPAKAGVRGQPDENRRIGDRLPPESKVVWQTWKTDFEAEAKEGGNDSASLDGPTPDPELSNAESGCKTVIGSFSTFSDFNQGGMGRFSGPLVAQNRTYVRYEVRLNQTEFDFIRAQQLFRRESWPGEGERIRFPVRCAAVKAAWKIIKPDELDASRNRYFIAEALVFDPATRGYKTESLALIGLHIVQKTPSRPQWIWSSFEHVDNVPDPEAIPDQRSYSLNDPGKPQRIFPASAPQSISISNPPVADPTPTQVVRLIKIADSTRKTNSDYHAILKGTVWENYDLVMTQWPKFPEPEEENGAPFPGPYLGPNPMTNIANTSMETYFQKSASTSCMACHDIARRRGFDFVWFLQMSRFDR